MISVDIFFDLAFILRSPILFKAITKKDKEKIVKNMKVDVSTPIEIDPISTLSI